MDEKCTDFSATETESNRLAQQSPLVSRPCGYRQGSQSQLLACKLVSVQSDLAMGWNSSTKLEILSVTTWI